MDFNGTLLQLAIWIPLIMLWVFALVDLFRTPMNGLAKALWAIAIVFLPIVGLIAYFVAAPAMKSSVPMEAVPGEAVDDVAQVERLRDLNRRGVLDDAEYAKYKTYLVR